MPRYFLIARDGREARSSHAYTAAELRSFKAAESCYTFVGELTNGVKNVGKGCRKRGRGLRDGAVPAPAAAPAKPAAAAPAGVGRSRRRRRKQRGLGFPLWFLHMLPPQRTRRRRRH